MIRLSGDLDAVSGWLLVRVGQRLVRAGNPHLVVDCAGLQSLDHGGLVALAAICQMPETRSMTLLGTGDDRSSTFSATELRSPDEGRPTAGSIA